MWLSLSIVVLSISLFAAWSAFERCRDRRWWNRALERIRHPERFRDEPRQPTIESRWIVRVSDDDVACESPDGDGERIAWSALRRVDILSTSDGPFAPDQFWVLSTDAGSGVAPQVIIPWGATGERELLRRLQELPGFDNEAIVNAASICDDRLIPCWRKPE